MPMDNTKYKFVNSKFLKNMKFIYLCSANNFLKIQLVHLFENLVNSLK